MSWNHLHTVAFLSFLFIQSMLHASETLSVTHLWGQEGARNQGRVGACHSFGTIGLIEAEWKKKKGEIIDLSERDLFERHFFGKNVPWEGLQRQLCAVQHASSSDWKADEFFGEGGLIEQDFAIAKSFGICLEDSWNYEPYLKNGEMQRLMTHFRATRDLLQSGGLQDIDNEASCNENGFTWIAWKLMRSKATAEILGRGGYVAMARKKPPQKCAAERAKLRVFLQNYCVKKLTSFPIPLNEEAQAVVLAELKSQLRQERPVQLKVTDYHLILKGEAPVNRKAFHAVLLAEYRESDRTVLIRNSWGGESFDRVPLQNVLPWILETQILTDSNCP